MSNVSSKPKSKSSTSPKAPVSATPAATPDTPAPGVPASHVAGTRGTRVTWGPLAAILVTALSMAGAYLAAGLAAYLLPRIFHLSHSQAEAWFSSIFGQFVFIVIAESVIVAIIIRYLKTRRSSIRALGFHRKPQLKDASYVLITFGLYFVAVALVTTLAKMLLHVDLDQKQELGFDSVINARDMVLTFASLVIIPPIVEEFLFRGFLFGGLRTKLPFGWATVVTSILFASLHLTEGSGGALWVAGIDTFILSLFLCYVREKTGNLWAGILLHACKNTVAFLYLYVVVR